MLYSRGRYVMMAAWILSCSGYVLASFACIAIVRCGESGRSLCLLISLWSCRSVPCRSFWAPASSGIHVWQWWVSLELRNMLERSPLYLVSNTSVLNSLFLSCALVAVTVDLRYWASGIILQELGICPPNVTCDCMVVMCLFCSKDW